jgi:hypothetical protein
VALAGAWVWARLARWRRKDPAEMERLRRLDVNRRGRISAARILDWIGPEPGKPGSRLVVYKYEVGGVTYEAAQDLSALPEIASLAPYLAGQTVSVKYDPNRPTNSIVACEAWCGLPQANVGAPSVIEPLDH